MNATVRKLGNSGAVILPKPVLAHLGVEIGGSIELNDSEPGKITIMAGKRHPREGWEEDAKRIAALGLTDEEKEWLEAPLSDDRDWEW